MGVQLIQYWLMFVVLIPGGWDESLIAAMTRPEPCMAQAAHIRQFPDRLLRSNETVYCKEVIVL